MYERTRITTHGVDDRTAQQTLAGAALTTALPVAAVAAVAAPALAAAVASAAAVALLVRSPLGRTGVAPDERDPPGAGEETTVSPGGSHYPVDD